MRFNQNYFEIIQNRALFPGARSTREQNDNVALFQKKQFSEKSVRRGFRKVFSEQLLRSYDIYSILIQLFSRCQYHIISFS